MSKESDGKTQAAEKSIAKRLTRGEVRKRLCESYSNLDPGVVLDKAGRIFEKRDDVQSELSTDEQSLLSDALMILGHEKHYLVAESITDVRWRAMIMDLASCIQKEYNCITNSEIALAGLAAAAYYRSLKAGRKMNAILEREEIGMIGVNLMATVGKEIDRAHRQYLVAIETLQLRRQPRLNVKIQTKAAFFGENQVFGTKPESSYENNDPQ